MGNGFEDLFDLRASDKGRLKKKKLHFNTVLVFLDLIWNVQFPKLFKVFTHIHPSCQGASGHQGAVGSPGPAGPRVSTTKILEGPYIYINYFH